MKKKISTVLALGLCLSLPCLATAGDNALLQLLQSKGVLSAEDVASLSTQQSGDTNAMLVQLLQQKGIINAAEAHKISDTSSTTTSAEVASVAVTPEEHKTLSALKGWSFNVLSYLDYSAGQKALSGDNSESYNRFSLTRGYLTVKKTITPWLSGRMTTDIHRDTTAGAGTYGDYSVRLKYLYAQFKPDDFGVLTNMKVEAGQGHTPWLDFEEHLNTYRVQGTMATDRAGVLTSSDLGVSLQGNFGGTLADAVEKTGSHHYNGRYGSWHLGLFNSSGYHNEEVNGDKAIEGRLTLRPLPDQMPGLQLNYLGIYGEGNNVYDGNGSPDYRVNLGMLSYENPLYILTAQYYQTTGNGSGSWTYGPNNEALDTEGYSFFGRVRLPFITRKLALLGRYDHFDQDSDDHIATNTAYDMYLGGLSYDIAKGNQLLLIYENTDYEANAGLKHKLPTFGNNLGHEDKFQIAYQLEF